MGEFEPNDTNDNQKDRDKPDKVIGITKKDHATRDSPGSSNARPNSVGCANRDRLHRLRYREEAQDDKDDCNDAGNNLRKTLRILQRNRKTDFKKTSKY